jgi:hypothetical protein
MMKKSAKRKTFVAREDMLNRLSEIARKRGYSLYEMVNELFALAIMADALGLSLKKIVEERRLLERAKEAGLILGLESLWYEMADSTYEKGKKTAAKTWYDAGVWFAKRYVTSETPAPLKAFREDLAAYTWNAPEFIFEDSADKVSVRVASPRFTESYTFLFACLLEGALSVFGYKITTNEVRKGVIRLEAVRGVSS